MRHTLTTTLVVILAATLIGCAAMPDQSMIRAHTMDPDSLASIRTIAVLDIPNPRHYWLGEGAGTGTLLLGPLGMAAELSNVGANADLYDDFSFADIAQRRLASRLESHGYRVINRDVTRTEQHSLLDDYRALDVEGVDAFLDVVPVAVGFKGSQAFTLALPDLGAHVTVVARLVSAESKNVLYAETISYGYGKLAGATWIDPPPDQDFENAGELKANMDEALVQLTAGIDTVAEAIADRLGKPGITR